MFSGSFTTIPKIYSLLVACSAGRRPTNAFMALAHLRKISAMRIKDPGYWIRVILWMVSIAIVAIPVHSLKQSHGSLVYVSVSVAVLLAFFLAGLYISHKLKQRTRR